MVQFDPVCYSVNSTAMGDVLAAVPVVKYAIEKYHRECDYRVIASKHFRCFFHFVPDSKFLTTEDDTWKFDKKYSIRRLNDVDQKNGYFCRLTPAKMALSHYAAIGLLGEILEHNSYCYVPLPEVDVSHFGVDFSKAVILVVSYRDLNRSIPAEELVKIASYVQTRGFIPVYIGRTENGAWKERPPVSPFIPPPFGVDLRNQTSIPELATIMSKAIAVCGVDSGPVHLAGTTSTPLIAGYTNVNWKYRVPKRMAGRTIVIEPDPMDCRYCSSVWAKDFYNFLNCFHGHNNCVKTLRAEKYIDALNSILGDMSKPRLSFNTAWDVVKPSLLGQKKSQILYGEIRLVEKIEGDFAEIGVFKGNTSQLMRLVFPERKLHCYDTFCGIVGADSTIDHHKDGEFVASLEEVIARVGDANYHVGIFPESFKEQDVKFAFVHCDLDTYAGTKAVLETIFPCLSDGGILLFDDYHWVACPGVEKAITEWLLSRIEAKKDGKTVDECYVREYQHQCSITKRVKE